MRALPWARRRPARAARTGGLRGEGFSRGSRWPVLTPRPGAAQTSQKWEVGRRPTRYLRRGPARFLDLPLVGTPLDIGTPLDRRGGRNALHRGLLHGEDLLPAPPGKARGVARRRSGGFPAADASSRYRSLPVRRHRHLAQCCLVRHFGSLSPTTRPASQASLITPCWFTRTGGIRRYERQRSPRFLLLAEREEIALGVGRGEPAVVIARRLARLTSTVTRELARNGCPAPRVRMRALAQRAERR